MSFFHKFVSKFADVQPQRLSKVPKEVNSPPVDQEDDGDDQARDGSSTLSSQSSSEGSSASSNEGVERPLPIKASRKNPLAVMTAK